MILYSRMFFAGIVLSQIFFISLPSMAQTRVWTRLCGTTNDDFGSGVAADAFGNVYVAGGTFGALNGQTSAGNGDLFLIKYDSSGTILWTRQCGTTSTDRGEGVAADAFGNVYVAGYTYGSLDGQTNVGYSDICLVKYDSSGTKKWTRQCGSTNPDRGHGVAVDAGGNVYVVGEAGGAFDGQPHAGGGDICLVKYDSSGTKLWTRLCDSSCGYGVAVDAGGNVYEAGYAVCALDGQTNVGEDDMCLVKYDSSGTKLWTRLCGSAVQDEGLGVSVDAGGNVYVTGYTKGDFDGLPYGGGWNDLFLVKYDSSGTKQWARLCSSDLEDIGNGVAADAYGNVYVAGFTRGIFQGAVKPGGGDICIIKYDSNGTRLGAPIFGGAGNDAGMGVAVDGSGNVYVAGYAGGSFDGQPFTGVYDICLIKCSSLITKTLPFLAHSMPCVKGTDIQMFDIFGRKITSKDLSHRSAGIYLVRSKSTSFCEVKMLVK